MRSFKHLLNLKYQKIELIAAFAAAMSDLNGNFEDSEKALVEKVKWIVEIHGDVDSVFRMLKSFEKGTKRLPTDKYGLGSDRAEERSTWKQTAHGEVLSGGKNLPRGHFRWDFGERYVLTEKSLKKVSNFLETFF